MLGIARYQHKKSLLLRREFPDLERSLVERSLEYYGDRKYYNASKHVWRIDGRRVEFGHVARDNDVHQYQSAQYDLIGFDELTQFTQFQYEYLLSRARTVEEGQRVRIMACSNPGGEGNDWVMGRWAAWLDETHPNKAEPGELRWYRRTDEGTEIECSKNDEDAMSRTFIPALLADNPFLDDTYRKQLNLMPEPYRSQLLSGDWQAGLVDDAYQVIPRAWVKAAQARWVSNPPKDKEGDIITPLIIGTDIARGGDDQTTFAQMRGNWFDNLVKYPGRDTPDGQSVVTLLTPLLAEKDAVSNMDVIGVGASAFDIAGMQGLNVVPVNFAEGSNATDKSGQLSFVNMRAECYWRFRDWLDPSEHKDLEESEKPMLPPDSELLGDLCAPRWIMQSNGIKIEKKEDIKKRIGRSPDCGDAVVLAKASAFSPSQLVDFI